MIKRIGFLFSLCAVAALSAADFHGTFNAQSDRVWIGPEYWANPMEDWRVAGGRLECTRAGANRNVHVLTRQMAPREQQMSVSVRLGRLNAGAGSAGFRLGIHTDWGDYRTWCLKGGGFNVGVHTDGTLVLGNKSTKPNAVIAAEMKKEITLAFSAVPGPNGFVLTLRVGRANGNIIGRHTATLKAGSFYGSIALVNNLYTTPRRGQKAKVQSQALFWFDDWKLIGNKITAHKERAWGPILWAMHSLSRDVMKMTVQLVPLGAKAAKNVRLEFNRDGQWKQAATSPIHAKARTAHFRVAKWNSTKDVPYRVAYLFEGKTHYWTGTIRHDPVERKELVVAGFTGNTDAGFPNREIAANVAIHNPDVLFFSGDQIYEGVGGYGIYREPVDKAILNYLRKWYLFGWAFGDLMRDRPTLCLPDDHDVYQGNIWGENGRPQKNMADHNKGGYRMHPDFINAMQRTQTAHHPAAFDPTPIEQGIGVYYGDMVYGQVSFAVIEDRKFKSGPAGRVNYWKGRPDHVRDPNFDPKSIDKPGLKLLGARQLKFLDAWAQDWKGAYLKSVLSQTIFCNLANYHGGGQMFLIADLDSNGWPQTPRHKAVAAIRKGFAFHYAGDQHLPSIVHQGIENHGDAFYSFCVPSIAAGYPRAWRPDMEGQAVDNRPKGGGPNTGDYEDGLGLPVRVYAIGNPAFKNRPGALPTLHDKSSGYGLVRFNTAKQTITIECWRLLFDAAKPKPADQFPGWPRTIHMMENYGRTAADYLPAIEVEGLKDPVIQVINQTTKEIVYTLRIRGKVLRPKIYAKGPHTVKVINPATGKTKTLKGVKPAGGKLTVKF
ncbi:MAG: hypothetical protein MK236_01605 [Pedosphaera sp.]|nr:hypothetical protein [Pedosphaera sp.]